MKNIFIILFIVSFFFGCKRKQTPIILSKSEPLVTMPAQCYNKLQDANEQGIDCGGPCSACNEIVPTCTANINTLKMATFTESVIPNSCGEFLGYFEMNGSYSFNSTYKIKLNTVTPYLYSIYKIVPPGNISVSSNYSYFEASVEIRNSNWGNLSLSTGNVYISQIAGKYYATICNGSAYSNIYSTTVSPITGKVTCL
jgi:hypothetical protein